MHNGRRRRRRRRRSCCNCQFVCVWSEDLMLFLFCTDLDWLFPRFPGNIISIAKISFQKSPKSQLLRRQSDPDTNTVASVWNAFLSPVNHG